MTLNVRANQKYFFLIVIFSAYSLIYSLFEIRHLDFLYVNSLDIFSNYSATNSFVIFMKFLKTQSFTLHVLFLVKMLCLPLLIFDKTRRFSGILFLCLSFLFMKLSNNSSPEQGYLNLLLMIIVLYPMMFSYRCKPSEEFSPFFSTSVWFVYGLSYSVSGYSKFITPEWRNGTFMLDFILRNHTFNEILSFMIGFPALLKLATYFGLLSELTALPLSIFKKTRSWTFIYTTLLQISLLFLAEVYQITFGMLIFHLFLAMTHLDFFKKNV